MRHNIDLILAVILVTAILIGGGKSLADLNDGRIDNAVNSIILVKGGAK